VKHFRTNLLVTGNYVLYVDIPDAKKANVSPCPNLRGVEKGRKIML